VERLEPRGETFDLGGQMFQHRLVAKQVERCQGGGRGKWIAPKGMPMEELPAFGTRGEEGLEQVRAGERRGHRQVSAGQPLAEAEHVWDDRFVLAGEHFSRPAEPGGDLVRDQQHPMFIAGSANPGQ